MQLDVRARLREVRRRAVVQRHALHGRVARDGVDVAQLDLAAEAARQVRPQEAQGAAGDLEQPQRRQPAPIERRMSVRRDMPAGLAAAHLAQ